MRRCVGYGARIGACVPLCLALQAAAEQVAPPPAQPSCVRERDLMTPTEVAEHRAMMASMQSDAERAAFRRANHEEMKKRAATKGTVLCDDQAVGSTTGGTPSTPSPAHEAPAPSK